MNKTLLTLNAGSSSIKFAIFAPSTPPTRIISGKIERIGLSDTKFAVKNHGYESAKMEGTPFLKKVSSYSEAIQALVVWLEKEFDQLKIDAISHRVVHGGHLYNAPQIITPAMVDELKRLCLFDPEHLPNEILLIESLQQRFPKLQQIACFDTAFHHNMPRVAQLLAIPRHYQEKGVRRYGFHGLSYHFLMQELTRIADEKIANGRIVLAHLGSGTSLTAVHRGQSVDTSMGFTPNSGVTMSTRTGDIEPGLSTYLMQSENLTPQQFNQLVNFESGLLGISETSSDMRDLLDKQQTDHRAAEAIALFCYQIKKQIGAYAAVLGGLDALVFSGGIGENSAEVRSKICDGLEFLGIDINVTNNRENALMISNDAASVAVYIIPTDEEQMMASMMLEVLNLSNEQED
ncbi:MAG: acetate/propionate family kinase [Methylophilales bacterium]|nr:acetate/propionate family kinase [Methylophilales bacterium]